MERVDINAKNTATDSLQMMFRPKTKGRWILNLTTHNKSPQIKNVDKFFNRHSLPYVNLTLNNHYKSRAAPSSKKVGSFWWNDVLKTLDKFKGIPKASIKDGHFVHLWYDLWDTRVPSLSYHELFSYAINKTLSSCKLRRSHNLRTCFTYLS